MRSQSEEVDAGVDGGGEEHEEAELFPHSQPGVQPEGEAGVLCAPAEIEGKYFFFWGGGILDGLPCKLEVRCKDPW